MGQCHVFILNNKIIERTFPLKSVFRLKAFASNLEYIAKHNDEAAEGKHTFTLGVNKFADLTHEEYVASLNRNARSYDEIEYPKTAKNLARPDSVDWRDEVRYIIECFKFYS